MTIPSSITSRASPVSSLGLETTDPAESFPNSLFGGGESKHTETARDRKSRSTKTSYLKSKLLEFAIAR